MQTAFTKAQQPAKRHSRPHLHELDMVRVITALGVVAVHTLGNTAYLNASLSGLITQHGLEMTMHYTREVFMFTTAFVLVYSYVGKPFSLGTFSRKRAVGVVLPYAAWSIFYVIQHHNFTSPTGYWGNILTALYSGNGEFQLYYILLTIQFYIVFPVLLWMLPWLNRHPVRTLVVSGVLELAMMYLYYDYIEMGTFGKSGFGLWVFLNAYKTVFTYQFYFVLGAICALHLDRVQAWGRRYWRQSIAVMAIALAGYWAHYLHAVDIPKPDFDNAISVLQPSVVIYSIAVVAFLWAVSAYWASRSGPRGLPRGAGFWSVMADASFGIYLAHPLFMHFAMYYILPGLTHRVPVAVEVALVWVFAATLSTLLTVFMMRIPVVSRLVGRNTPLPEWMSARWLRTRVMVLTWITRGGTGRIGKTNAAGKIRERSQPKAGFDNRGNPDSYPDNDLDGEVASVTRAE